MKQTITVDSYTLRPPKPSDAEDIYNLYASDTQITKYLAWKPHLDVQQSKDFIASRIQEWQQQSRFTWCIENNEGQLVGVITTKPQGEFAYSISYVIGRAYWGHGIATKVSHALLRHLIDLPSIYRVEAYCDTNNIGSKRVLEKLGMTFEGVAKRKAYVPNLSDEPQDCLQYAFTR